MNPDQFKKHLNAVQIQIKPLPEKMLHAQLARQQQITLRRIFRTKLLRKRNGKKLNEEKAKYSNNTATITFNLPYSAVHNEGLRAGRGRGFRMPKRQFMAHSSKLAEKTEKEIIKILDIIIHKTK